MLANVTPGRSHRLHLNLEQRHALSDRDGRLILQVIRAEIRARERATAPEQPRAEFPLTEFACQAIAHRLGVSIGIKRARRLIRRAIDAGILIPVGSYRQRYRITGASGHRVKLHELGVRITGRIDEVRPAARPRASVGSERSVKADRRVTWYLHALFGTPDGLPPPCHYPRQRARLDRWRERKAA